MLVAIGTIGSVNDWPGWPWWLVGSASPLAAFVLVLWCVYSFRTTLNHGETDSQQITRTLTESLAIVHRKIAGAVELTAARRPKEVAEVANLVVQLILMTYAGVEGMRASVFVLNDEGNRMDVLVSRGRPDWPRPFDQSDRPRGSNAIGWLVGNVRRSRFARDIEPDGDDAYGVSGDRYRTFISCAIYTQTDPYGMLSVDATTPGALEESEKHLIQAFADALAVAFTLARPEMPGSRRTKRKR
ncbi:GAF domain-containing protein [Brevibacterium litoralis]|uniref:GAF domain-containing protein n=1 Tax=Brevibacterium litoralis TaxID=3138935 RepID=UPI0032EF2F81